jgi:hypothetical protein
LPTVFYAVTDEDEVIPYTVWGATEKVSLTVHSVLKFHGISPVAKVLDMVQTNWVNYIFKDEHGWFVPGRAAESNYCIPSKFRRERCRKRNSAHT